jgi:hypothetical protein
VDLSVVGNGSDGEDLGKRGTCFGFILSIYEWDDNQGGLGCQKPLWGDITWNAGGGAATPSIKASFGDFLAQMVLIA